MGVQLDGRIRAVDEPQIQDNSSCCAHKPKLYDQASLLHLSNPSFLGWLGGYVVVEGHAADGDNECDTQQAARQVLTLPH